MKIKCTEYYQKNASLEIVKQSASKYLCIHCITFRTNKEHTTRETDDIKENVTSN